MRPSVRFVTVCSLLAACGPNVVERASAPSSPPAVEEADETVPSGERLERRLALVRWGAPLRYAPEDGGPMLRDEAWSSRAKLEARPDLMGPLRTSSSEIQGQLQRTAMAVHWADDAHGVPNVLVAARDSEARLRAAAISGEPHSLPERGWTPLR